MKAPSNVCQLRSFLGLANYFRTFVRYYAVLAKPLTRLCSAKVRFSWEAEEQAAFEAIKSAILAAPMLRHVDYDKEIILRTDASMAGIGGMLLQRAGGVETPICFVSKAFTPAEMKWSTIEQAAFAMFYCEIGRAHV